MTKLNEHLINLGLAEKESKTYLSILELGSSTIKPIADHAGIKRTSIYNFIDRLVKLGLVSRTIIRGRSYYSALSPTALFNLQKDRLNSLESALPLFLKLFNKPTKKPKVHYYEGPEEIKNIVLEELNCKKEALYVWTGKDMLEMAGGTRFMGEVERKRQERKIFIRTIRFKEHDVKYPFSSHGKHRQRELRWAPEGVFLPMGLSIYDTGKVGLFSSRKERFAILVESQDFAQTMRVFYELLWRKCVPANVGEG